MKRTNRLCKSCFWTKVPGVEGYVRSPLPSDCRSWRSRRWLGYLKDVWPRGIEADGADCLLVAADWLEEQGQPNKARLLRKLAETNFARKVAEEPELCIIGYYRDDATKLRDGDRSSRARRRGRSSKKGSAS